MHHRSHGDAAHGQAVTRLDRRRSTRVQHVTRRNALWRNDVATLAVGVQQQCDVCGAIRIVFYALNLGANAVLGALKVDLAVVLPVTTTNMPSGDTPSIVSAARFRLLLKKRPMWTPLVQTLCYHLNLVATSCRCGFTLNDCHDLPPQLIEAKSIS